MPIPELTEQGFLPVGIHECSFDELQERFGRFQRSDQRIRLCNKLDQFLQEASSTDLVKGILVDGSFVTQKEEPNDIDIVLVLHLNHDFASDLRPFEYNVISKKQVRKRYQFDIMVACEGGVEYQECVDFFTQVRGKPLQQKGLLWIPL